MTLTTMTFDKRLSFSNRFYSWADQALLHFYNTLCAAATKISSSDTDSCPRQHAVGSEHADIWRYCTQHLSFLEASNNRIPLVHLMPPKKAYNIRTSSSNKGTVFKHQIGLRLQNRLESMINYVMVDFLFHFVLSGEPSTRQFPCQGEGTL